jgi:hypothetical protein
MGELPSKIYGPNFYSWTNFALEAYPVAAGRSTSIDNRAAAADNKVDPFGGPHGGTSRDPKLYATTT